jgi:hypothetical protein
MRHEPVFQGTRYVVLDYEGVSRAIPLPPGGFASWRRAGHWVEFRHSDDLRMWVTVGWVKVE